MLVIALIVAGLVSLLVGFAVDQMAWVYAALVLCALSLAIMVYESRRCAVAAAHDNPEQDESTEPTADPDEDTEPAPVTNGSATDETVSGGDTVQVVPGRKRYHLSGCSLIKREKTEEVMVAEAAGEGFSPCTKCAPPRLTHA